MEQKTTLLKVGYAYVVVQRMEKVYQPKRALMEGTIFPELNITMGEYGKEMRDVK